MKKSIAQCTIFIFSFALLISLPSCVHKKDIDKQILHITPKQTLIPIKSNNPPPITVWIHGTLIFRKPTHYNRYHKNPHIAPIAELPKKHRLSRLAHTIVENDPKNFSLKEFYIFGWSGLLSENERKIVANKLYHDLIDLTKSYEKKYHCYPVIRIIAHSHGGNVALHMAKIKSTSPSPLTIRSLILLACPVQEKTMHLIDTPMFQRIYSLYSSFDLIQILAPQLRYTDITKNSSKRRYKIPSFSSRRFPRHPHVIQAKIKIDNFPISHTYFSSIKFAEILPQILTKLDSWDVQAKKDHMLHKYKLLCIYKRKPH